ncbi:MAG: tetratricopeptide repeat protein, partial [Blastocatellia bacterium]
SAPKRILAGNVYLKSRKFKEAEKLFKEAIKLDPSDFVYLGVGICYWEARQNRKAIGYFDKAAKTAPIEMLLEIAIHMIEGGMSREAGSFLDKAIERDPTHPIPHMIKGIGGLEGLSPIALILMPDLLEDTIGELTEAARLMDGRPEYADILPEIRQILRMLKEGPGDLFGGFANSGGPPGFFFDDDDDDDDDGPIFDFPPSRPARRRRRR